jgi:hypothetical protein
MRVAESIRAPNVNALVASIHENIAPFAIHSRSSKRALKEAMHG